MLAIGDTEIESALKTLLTLDSISESMILSTCNRTEIYSHAASFEELIAWYAQFRGFSPGELQQFLYKYSGKDVVKHAFRVACGLDSMVLGETQILGQLKNSARIAHRAGTLGPNLRRLFDASFAAAKYIRTETEVGAHSVSLAAASARVAERIFGSLTSLNVSFIGAGDMNRMCAEHFSSVGAKRLSVTNRTMSRAADLADSLRGDCFPLSDISHKLNEFDIVVSCTGSPTPVVGKRAIEKAVEVRKHKPILLIDLAVPRDIELEASDLEDVFLYTIDDLGGIVKDGMRNRQDAAKEAEKLIESRLIQFKSQLERNKIAPVIKKYRQHGEQIMQSELDKALSSIAKGETPEQVVRTLARAISNKFMDEPSRALSNATRDEKVSISEALQRLYGLEKN